ncbi:DUF1972 domain-containing protein [Rhodococcus sp. IEGM 1354]|uniref:glycosyltransferase n=1 Tax=Rhodococcus sp. IEGM 1354 TaxID=3047088 RepID=UPI0024B6A3D1|nr:glycosyltransferase [Rhodococcus sp. IEGM 1354]MDI9929499.1 DUF1972 domain-containing protein [Rhodococcus sp. IEGM 1354]
MKRSVAIIGTRGYPSFYGGFETLLRQLCPYLAEDDWDVTVYGRDAKVLANGEPADSRINSVITRGIESKSASTLSYGLTSTVHAARTKPDVALVMNVANGFWLPILKARGVPTVVNVDGIEWEREKWGQAAKGAFKAGAFLTAKYADKLVFDANEIGKKWDREFGRDGSFIPYGGAEPPQSEPVDGFPHRGYVLMVARFVPENTIEQFFDAAEEVSRKWPVAIVGSSGYGGDLDSRAHQLASQFENIHWFGHMSDDAKLFALWQHAGAYFHGHSVGGTNPALVQAMACSAPIVARDTVFNREVLDSSAVFVQPTAASISDGLMRVLSDPSLMSSLSQGAKLRQEVHYTWDSVCKKYSDLLRSSVKR